MGKPTDFRALQCQACANGEVLDFDFSMAFQPIVDVNRREVFAQEALVRTCNGGSAQEVFARVNDGNRYRFDQMCRVKAVKLASELAIDGFLSINFMPNAVYRPELCIRTTLEAAHQYNFPIERIIFEVTEGERVEDNDHLCSIVDHYQQRGFLTALDDFGADYSGLNLLAAIQTDLIKIDLGLIRGINDDRARQAIVRGIMQTCADLDIRVIAEGIETKAELDTLREMGISLIQGFLLARPAFERQSAIDWSVLD